MARRVTSSIHRGFWYDQQRVPPRLKVQKDGITVFSMDDDGKDTSGDTNGPATKINQSVTTTGDVTGFAASPRCASSVDCASLTAIKAEPILKGTNSLSGDFRAIEITMDDAAGTATVAGDAIAIRVFSQMRVNPSGDFAVMEVEAQGDGGVWDYFTKFPNDGVMAFTAFTTATLSGAIKVKVGSADRFIQLYTKVPVD
ncbi:hypothetical protein LCGC14_2367690 [marine sediment metagenome]|uniref:Uncharacterized protein n=2 Tax=marine sediment metagenome TaxID=412755 RepID=A0A0F9C4L2_9ZZZZ